MTVAGVEGTSAVKCSRDVVIVPDTSLAEACQKGPFDAIILPGGAGYKKFAKVCRVLFIIHVEKHPEKLILELK